MSSSRIELDPFLVQAQNDDVTPAQKIEGMRVQGGPSQSHFPTDLHKVIQNAQTGMLTTRASDGHLHARAMTPAGREPDLIVSLTHYLTQYRRPYSVLKHPSQSCLRREQCLAQV
jgi:hypothetical protein